MAGADEVSGQNLAGHAQFSRDPQAQFVVTAAPVASATVLLPNRTKLTRINLFRRADDRYATAEVQVVIVERCIENTCDSAADS